MSKLFIAGAMAVTSVFLLALIIFHDARESKPVLSVASEEYRFTETACWFDIPWPEDIRCGELHTPTSTGAFVLPVVRILDSSPDHQPDPVIYLQGGPGGSAQLDSEGIEYWRNWLRYANLGRDFILMDPRGVGRSKPGLTCEAYDQFALKALRQNLAMKQELIEGYAIVEGCFARLAAAGFKVQHYGTQVSAEDLRALMKIFSQKYSDYQSWNLLGVSYGTRLALTAAHEYPLVGSLVLDSVYPAGKGGLQSWPMLFDQSLNNFFSWCTKQDSCRSSSEVPMIDQLMLALHSLRDQPMTLTVARWNGEAPIELVLNDHRFLGAVFSAIYSKHDWVHIAGALEAVNNQERAGLKTLLETFINNAFSDSFSGLVFMAVDCMDHPARSREEYQASLRLYPQFAEYFQDLWQYQACHFLAEEKNVGLETRALPDVPALLLAGTLDPITPVAWAQSLHEQWPGSQLKIVEHIGHAVINSDACVHRSLRQFLDAPSAPFNVCESSP